MKKVKIFLKIIVYCIVIEFFVFIVFWFIMILELFFCVYVNGVFVVIMSIFFIGII